LIDRDFAGNVNRAAKAWGVPQPTLHRYVNRLTEAPNARTLQRIARFYGTTVEWLLDGVRAGPLELEYPIAEFRAWETLVKALSLPTSIERLVLALPGRISAANFALCEWGMFNWPGKRVSEKRIEPALRARWLASAMELEAWTVWLRGLITSYGKLAVRNKLESEADRIRLGFQPFAMYLRDTGRLSGDLGPIYDEIHPPGQPRGVTLLNEPPIPALNAVRGRQPSDGPHADE
jgi:hypothetical protein